MLNFIIKKVKRHFIAAKLFCFKTVTSFTVIKMLKLRVMDDIIVRLPSYFNNEIYQQLTGQYDKHE